MSELGPEARSILDEAIANHNPPPEEAQRMHADFMRRLAAGAIITAGASVGSAAAAAAPTASAGAAAGAAGAATAASGGMLMKLVLAVSLASAVGGGVTYAVHAHKTASPRSAVASPSVEAPAVASAAPGEASLDSPLPPPTIEPVALAPATSATAEKRDRRAPSRTLNPNGARSGAQAGSLDEELPLIARAQDALAANQPDTALVALNEHATRFPNGQLAAERSALRVLATCSKGGPGASAMAEQFVRTHPRSPLAPRIRQECAKK